MLTWQFASDLILTFLTYAFLGWVAEVVYCAVQDGRFSNRGFLAGPVVPIYAFGALLVLFLLAPVSENPFWIFVGGALLCTLLELVTGWALERIFRQRWWDYTGTPFNIGGYVNLKMSILWGLACLLLVEVLHPGVELLLDWLPDTLQTVIVVVCLALFLIDFVTSVQTALKLKHRVVSLDRISMDLRELSDNLGERLAGRSIEAAANAEREKERLVQRRSELRDDIGRRTERLLDAFPQLRSLDHPGALKEIDERRRQRKGDGAPEANGGR